MKRGERALSKSADKFFENGDWSVNGWKNQVSILKPQERMAAIDEALYESKGSVDQK